MGLLAAFLASLMFALSYRPDALASSANLLVHLSLVITLSCYLLLPIPNTLPGLLGNCASSPLLLLILSQLFASATIPTNILLQQCITCFCLSLLLWSLRAFSAAIFPDYPKARNPALLLVLTIASAPIWLAPVIYSYPTHNTIIHTIISITPLTHFSVAAEYDYLRNSWFYQNTPFGSLPYAYPGLAATASGYLLLSVMFQLLARWPGIGYRSTNSTDVI